MHMLGSHAGTLFEPVLVAFWPLLSVNLTFCPLVEASFAMSVPQNFDGLHSSLHSPRLELRARFNLASFLLSPST